MNFVANFGSISNETRTGGGPEFPAARTKLSPIGRSSGLEIRVYETEMLDVSSNTQQ